MSTQIFRTESDSLGTMQVPSDAFYGIHSLRAKENFPDQTVFHLEWYKAVGIVKLACYNTYLAFRKATLAKYGGHSLPFSLLDIEIIDALEKASKDVSMGKYYEQFIVSAVSGGAGTSINMNINEIIANVALKHLGLPPGAYTKIDPIESANIYQSTNDVIPTSLRVAVIRLLTELEQKINNLRQSVESCETRYRNNLRIAYTQMQEAVPSSYGKLFGSYNEALSRDWWRVSKCFERIKVVNLGGSAVGTGIGVPRYFIMEVVGELQKLTGMPLTRSENLPDATQNLDSLVEVHAILKSHAVNLEKIVSDMRLLASDINNRHELNIPQRQVGSSIMPGKINPVIPEYVISVSHSVYANDALITSLCAQGCLDLNAYLPVIGHALIGSLKLLISADTTLKDNLFAGIKINKDAGTDGIYFSPSVTAALSPYIGYNKASVLAKKMKETGCDIFNANMELKMLDNEKLTYILKPENLLKAGFSLNDIFDSQ